MLGYALTDQRHVGYRPIREFLHEQ
ncbi:hypothetical protein [Streptomyces sp. NPDC002521]